MTKSTKKSLNEISAELEAQGKDVAYKIWLAGVGAYGRAYDETVQNMDKANESATEFFEDLVKRGAEIESDVRERVSSNEHLEKSRERVNRVVAATTAFQTKQRERFEARMDRMRSVLGMPRQDDQIAELSAKIDALTEQLASVSAAPAAKASRAATTKSAAAARVAKLSDSVAPKKAPAKKTVTKAAAKPAAKKTTPRKSA